MRTSLKKPSGHVGARTCVAGISSQSDIHFRQSTIENLDNQEKIAGLSEGFRI